MSRDSRRGTASLSEAFARLLLDRATGPLSEPERRNATVLLADFLACVRAGLGRPGCLPPPRGSDGSRLAGEPGMAERYAPLAAAAAHAGDRDDVHWGVMTHPGSVVWPVVLWLGAEVGAGGTALLGAASAGYEACARMAAFLGPGHGRWFHSTATAGTLGAATAAGALLGLGDAAMGHALGHAISAMGGSAQCLDERSGTRLFHRSSAVRTGIAAARAAAQGLDASRLGFEGERGLLGGPEAGARDQGALLDERPPAIGSTSVRLFATSGWNQAAVQAAAGRELPAGHDLSRATVHVHRGVAAASTGPKAAAGEGWWSLELSVAAALATGDPQASADGEVVDGDLLRRLAERVVVIDDQPSVLCATVTVETGRGSSTTTVERPSGHADNPASADQLTAKWSTMQPGAWRGAERLQARCEEALTAPDSSALKCLRSALSDVPGGERP